MEKKLVEVNSLKIGGFILLEGTPCKIVSIKAGKGGKHGSAKARIEGIGIVDGRRRTMVTPTHARVEVPIIEKKTAQIVSISGDKANCMDTDTYEMFEMEIPDELKGKVKEGNVVIYWDVAGVKMMKTIKS